MGDLLSDSDSAHRAVLRKVPSGIAGVFELGIPQRTSSLRASPERISSAPELQDLDILSSTGEAAQRRRASHRISRSKTLGRDLHESEEESDKTNLEKQDASQASNDRKRSGPDLVMPFASIGSRSGTTEMSGRMQKSMSWFEASGQAWRHPCEDEEDEGHDFEADLRMPATKALQGWEYVLAISEQAFEELAMQFAPPGATSARATNQAQGMNNLVHTITFAGSNVKYCIRVPCCGSVDLWDSAARAALRNTVDMMRFLRSQTRMRVPAIIAWDERFKNVIQAPFVMMEFVPGQRVEEVWWGREARERTDDIVTNTPELEAKRQNILRSIAEQVVELRGVTFDRLGMFALQNGDMTKPVSVKRTMLPFIHMLREVSAAGAAHQNGNGFMLGGDDPDDANIASTSSCYSIPPELNGCHTSSYEEHANRVDFWRQKLLARRTPFSDMPKLEGIFRLYLLMLEHFPFASRSKDAPSVTGVPEMFVLGQTDFQPQNIFVDDDGNVTGFIDWDMTDTKPRYNGWARQPLWLCTDWVPADPMGSSNNLRTWPGLHAMPTWELSRYRRDYARYLVQACDKRGADARSDDWRFVLKNHIFDAIIFAIGKPDDMERVLKRILTTHIGDSFDWNGHLIAIGHDGFRSKPGLEEWYGNFFSELFSCDATTVKAELGLLGNEADLQCMVRNLREQKRVTENVARTQRELLDVYREQIELSRKCLHLLESSQDAQSELQPDPPKKRYVEKGPYPPAPSPDVSWHSWNSQSEYLMSGALRPVGDGTGNVLPSIEPVCESHSTIKRRKRPKWRLVARRITVRIRTWTFRWGQ